MRKPLMLTLTLVMILLLVLAGCGNIGNSSGEPKKITLSVMSGFVKSEPGGEVFQDLLNEFQMEHSNVTINENSATLNTTYKTKSQTQWTAGDIPDLTYFFGDENGEFIFNSGKVVSMEEVLNDNPDWASDFKQATFDQMKKSQGGSIYTIPVSGYHMGLVVNKKLFEENDLDLPENWEQFETAIKTFAKSDIIPISVGLEVDTGFIIDNIVLATGGVEGHSEPFSEAYVQGLNLIEELYEMKAFPKDTLTIDNAAAQNYYKTGKAAMMIDGSWMTGGLPDDIAQNTVVLPMPVAPNGKLEYGDVISAFSTGWYLSKEAYNDENKKELIVKLLKHLTSKGAIEAIVQARGDIPAVEGIKVSGLNPAQESGLEMFDKAKKIEASFDSVISSQSSTYIREHVSQVVAGKTNAIDVIKEAKQLNDQLK